MPKKDDDALPLRGSTFAKGPTAEELNRQIPQKNWLDEKINWKRLRRFAYSNTSDATIGREIVQEVYNDMCLWDLEDLKGWTDPESYVRTAVLHRIWKRKKQQSKTVPLSDELEYLLIDERSTENILEDQDFVLAILGKVRDEWLEPWLLHRDKGYTYEEVAKLLGLSIDQAKKRVRRADALVVMLATTPPEPSIVDRVRNLFKHKERRNVK